MRELTQIVIVAFTAWSLATSAQATTLVMTTDKANYAQGETIIVTVTGDSQGAVDTHIIGKLTYDASLVSPDANQSQNPLESAGLGAGSRAGCGLD